MIHDGTLDLAVGMSARSKVWKNKSYSWSDLVTRLKQDNKTNETLQEFIAAPKTEQSKIKDVGGYVGGYLRSGRRKPANVVHRQLLTLDIDFANIDFWDDFCLQFDNAAVLHSTHSHTDEKPRFRLIMPLSREAAPDEYVAIARQVAGIVGIELFDNTTFETNRLMYWPSTSRDSDYYFKFQDGPWIDADEVLDSYADWTDSSLWPTADSRIAEIKDLSEKQQDPETKRGIVGAFCRAYSISEAISELLKEEYVEAGEDRYTYIKGTAAAGLVTYSDKFAYSHHGTDPASNKLCNAFDLVRIHKFGHLDNSETNEVKRQKSYQEMEAFARSDKRTLKTLAKETINGAKYDFKEDQPVEESEEDLNWAEGLEVDNKGKYLSTAINLNLIFANDKRLKGAFKQNTFDGKKYLFKSVPWRAIKNPEPVKNVDYSGVRNYIESIYGISGNLKIDDSLALEFEKHCFNPVKKYLDSLEWDGVERVDELLITYFKAEDCVYVREAIRKALVGAVARIYRPGIKFDLVLTLVSSMQGTGKSSFFRALGQEWFSDSFTGVNGKEAYEQLQGTWLMELAELKGLRRAEVEAVKHFISKQEDIFRPAYGRVPETFSRHCIFVATTNEQEFLRDPSGNRRFMPVDVNTGKLTKNEALKDFIKDKALINQIWAEAVALFKQGETLYLSEEAEVIATTEQEKHSESDERYGIIEAYLAKKLPKNWGELDIHERRTFINDPLSPKGELNREFVCVAEIWCECLGKNKDDMDRYKTREINDILKSFEGWEQSKSTKNFRMYGKQKYYAKTLY